MSGWLIVADVVGGRRRRGACVSGRQRQVARAQVVRRRLGLPLAGEYTLLVASHSSYRWNRKYLSI